MKMLSLVSTMIWPINLLILLSITILIRPMLILFPLRLRNLTPQVFTMVPRLRYLLVSQPPQVYLGAGLQEK